MDNFLNNIKKLKLSLVGSYARGDNMANSDIDTITTENINVVENRLKPFTKKVYRKGKAFLSVLLQIGNIKKKVDVFLVDSKIWGKMYYSIEGNKIIGLRRYIKKNRLPFNINQYGFFENGKLNKSVKTYKQLKAKLNIT